MKRKLISSFIISCYLLLIYFILKEIILINAVPNFIGVLLFSITIALAITNIINAIITALNKENKSLMINSYSKTILVFKLIMIPFFILNFIMWYMAVGLIFLFGGFLLIPIGIAFTYIILLSSSTHVIAELYVYYKNRKITFNFFIVHSILQLLYVIDIIDYIYVHQTLNRINRNE